MRQALVIQHVAFEDLGTLAPALSEAGYSTRVLQAGVADLAALDPLAADLLVVLGGPIGAHEQAIYPWLTAEIDLIRRRLAAQRPTLGICLGSQLMAAALGARVFPGARGKEIGWKPVTPCQQFPREHFLAPLFEPGVRVLHWHGDTFELPLGAVHLASTEQYPNQAFALEGYALAMQFHPEAELAQLERWHIGHAVELVQAGIAIPPLRAAGAEHGPRLEVAARAVWSSWLNSLR